MSEHYDFPALEKVQITSSTNTSIDGSSFWSGQIQHSQHLLPMQHGKQMQWQKYRNLKYHSAVEHVVLVRPVNLHRHWHCSPNEEKYR